MFHLVFMYEEPGVFHLEDSVMTANAESQTTYMRLH